MQNITRTLTNYEIKAYDLCETDNGLPSVQVVAECNAEGASMTKSLARAELAAATGNSMPRGLTIKWKPVGTTTYAMPLDKFLENATVIKREPIEPEVTGVNPETQAD